MRVRITVIDRGHTIIQAISDKIVDIELAMYDEIMLSTMSSPNFKVTIFSHRNTFSYIWQEIKQLPTHLLNSTRVEIIDKSGYTLASGNIFEYNEKRDEGTVEITCRSDIDVFLDEEATISTGQHARSFFKASRDTTLSVIADRCSVGWFKWVWEQVFPSHITYSLQGTNLMFFRPFAVVIQNALRGCRSGEDYSIRAAHNYRRNRYEIIRQLAFILNAKFIFDYANNRFIITPFDRYSDNPIHITGYVSNERHEVTEQLINRENIFVDFRYYGSVTGSWSILDPLNIEINSRLVDIVKYKSYNIWGYVDPTKNEPNTEQIIYSGQTINLDGIDYYVQDIKYEVETLDTMKTFHATCVRFLSDN
jgi:hypothetical protein